LSQASIKDVAAHAHVSVGTVSNVLNRPELVAEATRLRVQAAIETLGFVRNEPARQLRAGRSRAIAYVMLDASNPFFTDVARGVEDVARQHDLVVYLCTSDQDPGREADYYDLLMEQRVRGVLVTPVDADNPALAAVVARGVPVVLVDRPGGQDMCSVSVDDAYGGELAVGHLLDIGHERIAVIGGPEALPQVRERIAGSRRALTEAGLPASALTLLPTASLNVAEGRSAGQRLAGLPARRRPTAAFCANDLVALGLLQEMTRLGVSVPGELSIVGYDDIDFAAAAAVPLTSVRQPRQLLGRTAVELLLAETESPNGSHEHRQVEFKPELIVRESSARPA
jgi:LacI family transcriptional regulator